MIVSRLFVIKCLATVIILTFSLKYVFMLHVFIVFAHTHTDPLFLIFLYRFNVKHHEQRRWCGAIYCIYIYD